jgi:hypothetical protein
MWSNIYTYELLLKCTAAEAASRLARYGDELDVLASTGADADICAFVLSVHKCTFTVLSRHSWIWRIWLQQGRAIRHGKSTSLQGRIEPWGGGTRLVISCRPDPAAGSVFAVMIALAGIAFVLIEIGCFILGGSWEVHAVITVVFLCWFCALGGLLTLGVVAGSGTKLNFVRNIFHDVLSVEPMPASKSG